MSNESKFWLGMWAIIAVTLLSIIAISTSFYRHHNEIMVKMVEAGHDPIAVFCAMDDSMGDNPVCVIYATHKTNGE